MVQEAEDSRCIRSGLMKIPDWISETAARRSFCLWLADYVEVHHSLPGPKLT
jgi:hypothetical protein